MQQAAGNDPLIGARVGNYEVRRKLGEGGMGAVYLAEHPLIGKKVALKVLHSEFASNKDVVLRFFTEAKAVNDIQHPNIVDIVDYGELQLPSGHSGVYFIMEFLEGLSLSDLIRTQAPLEPERALRICVQVADALGASHRNNIVHRDLKPDNVILIRRRHEADFVKVLDFGIAKLTGDQPGSRRTRTGIVMGTPAYMSPEQCEGRGEVDHRTDVYALGILLYEMLTGKVPFEGEGYGEVLVQHLTQPPVRPSTLRGVIPPHVEAVCLRALEKRPDDRYPSMDEYIRALTDPVGYVEAAGGPAYFTSANLGAPQPTPYPAVAMPAAPLTPLPGAVRLSPSPPSWPTPAPPAPTIGPTQSRAGLYVALFASIAVLGVVGFLVFGRGGNKSGAGTGELDPSAVLDAGVVSQVPDTTLKPMDAAPIAIDAYVAPKPVLVTITIESRPPGAKVLRGNKVLGATPYDMEVEASDKKMSLVLKKSGYNDLEFEAELSVNTKLDLQLEEKRRGGGNNSGSKPGSGSSRPGDPDNTIDPFK